MSLDWNNPGFNSHPLSSLDRTKTVGSLFPTHALPRCKSKGHIIDEILSDAMGHPDSSGAIEFYWWPARPGQNLIWPLCQVQKLSLSLSISLTPVRKLGQQCFILFWGRTVDASCRHDKGVLHWPSTRPSSWAAKDQRRDHCMKPQFAALGLLRLEAA